MLLTNGNLFTNFTQKKAMTPEELKKTFYALVAAGNPYPLYERNKKAAALYLTLVSGEGMEELMQQFKPRETEEMFAQRKTLTKQIVTSVCKNVRDVEYKVPRSNSIIKTILGAGAKEVSSILAKFWGRYSFDDYMDLRWIELNDTDPNAFVVYEWQPFQPNEKAQPYPYEVPSENIYYFLEDNNILRLLIVLVKEDFTCYGDNNTIKLVRVDEETEKRLAGVEREDGVEFVDGGITYVRFNKKYYVVLEPIPHKLGQVPAIQVGFTRDVATRGLSYLPPWYAAIPVLLNLVTAKSELDLAIALHTFPQKVQYVPRCTHDGCNAGYMPEGTKCPSCKGTGYQVHTSSQDAIVLPLPGHPDEIFDLTKIMHYFYPPVELLEFMDKYVDKLSQRALQFVYNSEIYSRKEVAETATGKNIDLQAVYDTLFPLVKEMALQWEEGIKLVAAITSIADVNPAFLYSKDFKLKSMDGYYEDLARLNESKASPFIIGNVEDDIARLAYNEDRYQLNKYLTQKRFDPFQGESEASVQAKMADPLVPLFYRVLKSNFKIVFDRIELAEKDFYFWTAAKQDERIKKEVEALMEEVEEERKARAQEAAEMFGQGENKPQGGEQEEEEEKGADDDEEEGQQGAE